MYEMLVGYPPFYSDEPMSTCRKVTSGILVLYFYSYDFLKHMLRNACLYYGHQWPTTKNRVRLGIVLWNVDPTLHICSSKIYLDWIIKKKDCAHALCIKWMRVV